MSNNRILNAKDLATRTQQAKRDGKTVVFTNGIFDFIHKGHASYLEKAKELGDILIIGMNSDASTTRLKGPTRPINKQADRAFVLSCLRAVDYVTIFEEDTASETLDIIQPSIYCKGGDYNPDTLPETPTVKKNGGKVIIIPFVDGYSNSTQFEKIKTIDEKAENRADHVAGKTNNH